MGRFAVLLFVSSLFIVSPSARAATCAGATLPDTAEVDGKKLVLNGLGLRQATMMKVSVYVGALYLENKSADGAAIASSDKPRKLVLHFVHAGSKDKIAAAWSEGFENNTKDTKPLAQRIATLNGYMADMSSGDEMAFTYRPGAGLEVAVKGKVMGVIPGADFAEGFFNIFLGAKPPNAELKSGLLGGTCG